MTEAQEDKLLKTLSALSALATAVDGFGLSDLSDDLKELVQKHDLAFANMKNMDKGTMN